MKYEICPACLEQQYDCDINRCLKCNYRLKDNWQSLSNEKILKKKYIYDKEKIRKQIEYLKNKYGRKE